MKKDSVFYKKVNFNDGKDEEKEVKSLEINDKNRAFAYHAEMVALYQLKSRDPNYLRSIGAVLIVIRIKDRCMRNSKPCMGCYNKLKNLGIKVYYSIDEY